GRRFFSDLTLHFQLRILPAQPVQLGIFGPAPAVAGKGLLGSLGQLAAPAVEVLDADAQITGRPDDRHPRLLTQLHSLDLELLRVLASCRSLTHGHLLGGDFTHPYLGVHRTWGTSNIVQEHSASAGL